MAAKELIKKLNLVPHPLEGGHFAVSYVSELNVKPLDSTGREKRSCLSYIYYLIQNANHDPWHRLASDEMFSHHKGTPLKLYMLHEDGQIETKIVGDPLNDPEAVFVHVIPANTWFAGELLEKEDSFSLFSVSVCPGFEPEDCEFADVKKLAEEFPQHKDIIERFPAGPLKP